MNFQDILVKQIELNKAIIEDNKKDDLNLEKKQILALIVEVSELANEIQHFKYWKKNIKIDASKIVEEYSDGMHFYLSFGITLGMSNDIEPIIADDDLTLQFLAIYDSISKFSNKSTLDNFNNSFGLFIGLGKLLNYTDEDMKNAYLRKNEINFERIKNKY